MKSILKTVAAGLLALAIAGTPAPLLAQTTNKAAPAKKAAAQKQEPAKSDQQPSAHPFHGKLAAVDKTAKSIMIGKSTYYVTADTKITKDGKTATLDDGVLGEVASGYVKPGDGGKMIASSLRFGPKPEGASTGTKSSDKKKDK